MGVPLLRGRVAGGCPLAGVAVVVPGSRTRNRPETAPGAWTGSPPTPTGPVLCPSRVQSSSTAVSGLIRAGGPRSARGYPAAVPSPVGADPAVVGPYLATALGDQKWRSASVELVTAGMSNLTYVVTP